MSKEDTRAENELREERHRKRIVLEESGVDPYPSVSHRTHEIGEVRTHADALLERAERVVVAGRVTSLREHGGTVFCDLRDGTGTIQGYLKSDTMQDHFVSFRECVDRGDFIEVTGSVVTTKRGELSVLATEWRMLAKSVLPMPVEWFGIKDEDERYRKRYLDMFLSEELQKRMVRRSRFWNAARTFLLQRDFIEVETPVLETMPGGAEARPFTTHHNALDMEVCLRISAGELWQKKLLVAGFPKTFEIGRIFRNEGMSHEHLQDYTQLEFYEAYSDLEKGKVMVQELYRTLAQQVYGTSHFTVGTFEVDLASVWTEVDFCEALTNAYGVDPLTATRERVEEALVAHGIAYEKSSLSIPRGVDLLWKQLRKTIAGPAFLVNVPVYLEPLAKRNERDGLTVARFQVLLAGSEVGKGFSELNDPADQKARFLDQQAMRDMGDEEAQFADMEFVEALEYGMPPAFGFGVSERLFAFFENVSAREAQLFPLMRPRH